MTDWPRPRDGFASPRFAQPATFMRLPHVESPAGLDVALCGIPFDGGCSYRSGARMGPRHVREQSSLIRPWNSALRVHPFERLRVADCGDVDVVPVSIEGTFAAIERTLAPVVEARAVPLCVGGDHTVTLAVLRALARRHGRLGLVHFDAHPDTWDRYFGLPYYHGSTFRRAIEEGLIDGRRSIQVGIRGPLYGPEDFDFHREHGFEVIRIEDVKEGGVAPVVRRRRGGSGVRARHRHARGGRPHVVRGAGPGARAARARAGRRRHRRGLPALRRAGRHHRRPRREPALRAAVGGGARAVERQQKGPRRC